ncbi:MerR family transcriptional regulator [Streptomyces narbonensis]|uniref:MerR family transcriptional regulator n=1 Tax=Streptomyces narbonensis TaxID=67333 RepID=UPI001672ACA8|nr:MerR family transcriptional regulator [Streptomyces narbonensis]GGW05442.1 MerR family transcriptional regulator [Streptomyces narbonensis]
MRIGELSRRAGVSVATIKFYVREGLLPAGELTSPNQASYGEAHVQRLRLIRALLDVGGLSVAAIREVIVAVDDRERSMHKVLGITANRLVPRYDRESDAAIEEARKRVAELVAARGWQVFPDNPAGEALAAALAALDDVGHGRFAEILDAYADAAERVARADMDYVAHHVAREALVESAVVGTVLGDAIFAALRRLAHVDASNRVFGRPGDDEGATEPT